MSDPTFAPWVQPVAETLADGRRQTIEFARDMPPEFWPRASVVDGWTNQDLLAHLAGGNDQVLQTLLRGVTSHATIDPQTIRLDTEAENSRRVAERRAWSVAELIAQLERDGDETQHLLSKLTDDDRDLLPEGLGCSVGQFLRIVEHERHDLEHLAQLTAST